MPSPFPGMDPYLEHPGRWPGAHHRLITFSADALAGPLRPKYFAEIEERVYVSDETDPGRRVIIPDLHVIETARRPSPSSRSEAGALEVAEAVEVTLHDEIHEARLEIIDRESRQVVTVIEFLSPSNKVDDAAGRTNYEQKRREVLESSSHLVEIDLLREGLRFIGMPGDPPPEYVVYLSRRVSAERRRNWIWPIRLHQRLPVIDIPLRAPDPDVKLDLQEVLTRAYDSAGYDLAIDYGRDATPPLGREQAQWAREVLIKMTTTYSAPRSE